jgi:protein-disulfide isomerase
MPLCLPPAHRRSCALAVVAFVIVATMGASQACSKAPDAAVPPATDVDAQNVVRTLTIAHRPARGNENARLTFIEYSDYGCAFCAQYARDVYPRLVRDYVDTGQLRYVFKSYPNDALHRGAFGAHVAAACAGDQGRYWEMHDRLFVNQDNFAIDRFIGDARRVGVDSAVFRTCMASGAHDAVIREDIDQAVRGGVNGAPVFVVALSAPGGAAVTPLRVVVGAQPYQVFKDAIDAVLAQAGARGVG